MAPLLPNHFFARTWYSFLGAGSAPSPLRSSPCNPRSRSLASRAVDDAAAANESGSLMASPSRIGVPGTPAPTRPVPAARAPSHPTQYTHVFARSVKCRRSFRSVRVWSAATEVKKWKK